MTLLAGGSPEVNKYLSTVFEIFRQNLMTECGENIISPSNMLVFVAINVHDKEVKLDRNTDESYKLSVTQGPGENFVSLLPSSHDNI